MENKTSDRNTKGNFLTRIYPIPLWVLLIVIVLILLAWLMTQFLPRQAQPASVADDVQDCTRTSEGQDLPQDFTCEGQSGYTMTITNVAPGITAGLLPISDSEESESYTYPTDGVTCIAFIAGDLVFYDKNDDNRLVTSFPEPVTLALESTQEGALILPNEINKILEANPDSQLAKCLETHSISAVEDIVPIYLYTPAFDTSIHIWKPFQNYTIDTTNRTVTIEFMNWGDQQFGGGTRP